MRVKVRKSCQLGVYLADFLNIYIQRLDITINYPDDALFGLSNQFALELLGHLRVEKLIEGSLYG